MKIRSIVACAIFGVLTAGPASAAMDMFLKLDAVKGPGLVTPGEKEACTAQGGTLTQQNGKTYCVKASSLPQSVPGKAVARP